MRVESVVKPERTESVPEKEAVEEIVWPFTAPEVMAPVVSVPRVEAPAVSAVAKRLVEEATEAYELVEKKEVEVAAVVVERIASKFTK